jgi:type I restriction enzyme S subunit
MVREGYKQTEIGMIPEGWQEVTVEDIKAASENALATGPFGSSIGSKFFQEAGIPVIRGGNLSQNIEVKLNDDGLVFVSPEKAIEFKRSIVRKGDLIFTCWGTINQIGLIDNQAKYSEYIISNKQMKLTPNLHIASSLFLYFLFSGPELQNKIKFQNIGSSVPGFNLGQLRELRFRIPPLPEQRAIAQTLSDVDALIAALDKLIAKKRYLKTATMQQLLTGKKRLPGFGEEWKEKKLGDLGIFRSGNGFPTRYQGLKSGDFPFFKVSDMNNTGNFTFMQNANNWIAKDCQQELSATIFPRSTIVFAKIGAAIFLERKKILSFSSCLDNNMMGLVLNEYADSVFIHQLLLTVEFGKFVSTTALPSLSSQGLANLNFLLPRLEEQRAIATVLSDMDAAIAALETRRTKTQAIKQGMMQQLLTGKVRLV